VEWIDLADDRDRYRAFVNSVMNLWGSVNCGELLDQLRNCQFFFKKDFAPVYLVRLADFSGV
jgi:hypothetical protein